MTLLRVGPQSATVEPAVEARLALENPMELIIIVAFLLWLFTRWVNSNRG